MGMTPRTRHGVDFVARSLPVSLSLVYARACMFMCVCACVRVCGQAACCAWNGCAAWIVQSGTGPSKNDHNCTANTQTCCWLKPSAKGAKTPNPKSTAGIVTATPSRPVLPPPPPPPPPGPSSPQNMSGYHFVLVGATKHLVVERRTAHGGVAVLKIFDLKSLENGPVNHKKNVAPIVLKWRQNSFEMCFATQHVKVVA